MDPLKSLLNLLPITWICETSRQSYKDRQEITNTIRKMYTDLNGSPEISAGLRKHHVVVRLNNQSHEILRESRFEDVNQIPIPLYTTMVKNRMIQIDVFRRGTIVTKGCHKLAHLMFDENKAQRTSRWNPLQRLLRNVWIRIGKKFQATFPDLNEDFAQLVASIQEKEQDMERTKEQIQKLDDEIEDYYEKIFKINNEIIYLLKTSPSSSLITKYESHKAEIERLIGDAHHRQAVLKREQERSRREIKALYGEDLLSDYRKIKGFMREQNIAREFGNVATWAFQKIEDEAPEQGRQIQR